MKPVIALLLLASPLLFSCAHENKIYSPASSFEAIEYPKASIDVYPDDVRKNIDQYTNTVVAWAGIIRETTAHDAGSNNLIVADTTLDHHYFDWQENRKSSKRDYAVSPRGEGPFRVEWLLRRKQGGATTGDAEKFAAPGKLAIVYGIPQALDGDVVVLRYRYLRVIDPKDFDMQTYDYGRVGEPYRYIGK